MEYLVRDTLNKLYTFSSMAMHIFTLIVLKQVLAFQISDTALGNLNKAIQPSGILIRLTAQGVCTKMPNSTTAIYKTTKITKLKNCFNNLKTMQPREVFKWRYGRDHVISG